MGDKEYIPTMSDILLIRKRTTGINKIQIKLNYNNLCVDAKTLHKTQTVTVCDVGGAAMERKKWKHYFVGVTAVIYIVGLSSFDERYSLFDENAIYKIKKELIVFEQYINCKQLQNKQWILFLNKIDLFAQKIRDKNKSIKICFDEYDDDENNVDKQSEFISKQFSLQNRTNNQLYTHITCAIDENFMKRVLDDVVHIIINHSMDNGSMQ